MPFDGAAWQQETALDVLNRALLRVETRYTWGQLYAAPTRRNPAPGFCLIGALHYADDGEGAWSLASAEAERLLARVIGGRVTPFGTKPGSIRRWRIRRALRRAIARAKLAANVS